MFVICLIISYKYTNKTSISQLFSKLFLSRTHVNRYTQDQIYQAICNLILFERIKKEDDLSNDFTEAGYPTRILEYLVNTFESFDTYVPNDSFFNSEILEEQIKRDINELQNFLSK